jgi:hypothetical protein
MIDDISQRKISSVPMVQSVSIDADFSDQIVRHENSSLGVQGSFGPYKRSLVQTELIDI